MRSRECPEETYGVTEVGQTVTCAAAPEIRQARDWRRRPGTAGERARAGHPIVAYEQLEKAVAKAKAEHDERLASLTPARGARARRDERDLKDSGDADLVDDGSPEDELGDEES